MKVISTTETCTGDHNKRVSDKFQQGASEGRCLQCGGRGGFVVGKAVCTTHGGYDIITIRSSRTFEGGDFGA